MEDKYRFLWDGKQGNPEQRRFLTNELVSVFTQLGWAFRVFDRETPFSPDSPALDRLGDMAQGFIWLDGVVAELTGNPGDGRKIVSFAFLKGPGLSPKSENRIHTPIERTGPFQRVSIEPGASVEFSSLPPGMIMLMLMVKRLHIPGLSFSGCEYARCNGADWAERLRLFVRPEEVVRRYFTSGRFLELLRTVPDSIGRESMSNWRTCPEISLDEDVSETSPPKKRAVIVNPSPMYQELMALLADHVADRNPPSILSLFHELGNCGVLLGGAVVVHRDALVLSRYGDDALHIFPIWEIMASLPVLADCFSMSTESTVWEDALPRPLALAYRGEVIRSFMEELPWDLDTVKDRIGTAKWVAEIIEKRAQNRLPSPERSPGNRSLWRWQYWDGYFMDLGWDRGLGPMPEGISWRLLPTLVRFFADWRFSELGGIAILVDRLDRWIRAREVDLLADSSLSPFNITALVQLRPEEIDDCFRSKKAKRSNDLRRFFDPETNGLKEVVVREGIVDLKQELAGPVAVCGPWWPLAARMACEQTQCRSCRHLRKDEDTFGSNTCTLRKCVVGDDEEEFCLQYQEVNRLPDYEFVCGPRYRMVAGGAVGFLPIP